LARTEGFRRARELDGVGVPIRVDSILSRRYAEFRLSGWVPLDRDGGTGAFT
jgi:hypothetical protein